MWRKSVSLLKCKASPPFCLEACPNLLEICCKMPREVMRKQRLLGNHSSVSSHQLQLSFFPAFKAYYLIVSQQQRQVGRVQERAKIKIKGFSVTQAWSRNTCCTLLCSIHLVRLNTGAQAGQRGLTKGLQTGLDQLLPAGPLGEVSQGHHGFTRGGLGRAGFVEPVRAAWRRNSRPGAASRSHPPWQTPTREEWGGGGLAVMKMCVSLFAYDDVEYVHVHVFQPTNPMKPPQIITHEAACVIVPQTGAIVWT